jgi:vacuolar protein sorting-associated protein 54
VTQQREDEDPSSLSHSLPLLEKLSHYADTIEQHLVKEISLRSTSFFAALTNLHDLRSESEECLDRIAKLRSLLSNVDEKGAKKGLQVIRQDAKLRNLGKVRSGVREVEGIVEMTGVAKGLVSTGRWGEALSVIEEMDALWNTDSVPPETPKSGQSNGTHSVLPPMPESPPPEKAPTQPALSVTLSSLKAFSNLPSHLCTLTMEIATSLTSELVDVLRVDLVERINLDTNQGHVGIDQTLRDRLKPLLQGLSRTKGMREVTVSWRDVVLAEVRGAVKQVCLYVFKIM